MVGTSRCGTKQRERERRLTMAYEMRDNSGSLFNNDKKVEGDKKPERTGKVMINGVEYYVSAWTRTGQSAGEWQSLAFEPVVKNPPADDSDDAPLFGRAK